MFDVTVFDLGHGLFTRGYVSRIATLLEAGQFLVRERREQVVGTATARGMLGSEVVICCSSTARENVHL